MTVEDNSWPSANEEEKFDLELDALIQLREELAQCSSNSHDPVTVMALRNQIKDMDERIEARVVLSRFGR